jgi:hypothetical protein
LQYLHVVDCVVVVVIVAAAFVVAARGYDTKSKCDYFWRSLAGKKL